MRSRWNLRVSGSSLLLSLSTLSLSWSALAQDQLDAAAPAAPDAAPTPPPAPPPAEEDEDEEDAAPPAAAASADAAASGQADASPSVSVSVEPPPPAKDAGSTDSINVVILPGSAYPEPRIRGIVGGSLWMTMPGYQFPYLPKVEGKTGVQLGLSGSVWSDTTYARFISGTPETDKHQKRWLHQTRGVARVTPAYSTDPGWFVQGNAEFVAFSDQTVPSSGSLGLVDDLYVRAGKWNVFDITVGRFQGWEIYHYGMGLDQNTFERRGAERQGALPPQIYGLDFFWDRPTAGGGHYAAHLYPTDFLRFEILAELGTREGANLFAVRPIGILDFGFLKVKAGFELGETNPQEDDEKYESSWNGVGGAIQGIFDPYVEAGVNAAVGYKDNINDNGLTDLAGSTTTKSFGGFLNLHPPLGSLVLGGGANYTTQHSLIENQVATSPNFGESDQKRHFQGFIAVQYSFWDRLFLKFVGGRAWYQFEDNIQDPPHPYVNSMWSGRFRIAYNF